MKLLVLLIVSYAISCAAQSANDGLTLLNTVAKRYADAKSYRIEAIEEVSQQSELERTWEKTFLSAIVAPGGRYRYEGRSADGTAVFISDGTTKWVYHVDAQQYTQIAGPVEAPNANRLMPIDRAAENAKHIDLSHWLSGSLRSAVLLRDENLELNGRTIPCRVVRFTHADFRFHRKTDWKEDEEGTTPVRSGSYCCNIHRQASSKPLAQGHRWNVYKSDRVPGQADFH